MYIASTIILSFSVVGIILAIIGMRMSVRANDRGRSNTAGHVLSALGVAVSVTAFLVSQLLLTIFKMDAISLYKEGKAALYIDGNRVSDGYMVDGIDLRKYNIKVDDDKVYLTKKH